MHHWSGWNCTTITAQSGQLAVNEDRKLILHPNFIQHPPPPAWGCYPSPKIFHPLILRRQGTSSQYQNSYLDLAVWYWYSICQLNKNISKYWDGNAIYCQLLQPTNVNTTLCHRTDWDPLLCGCLSPDKVDLGFMKLALFPSRTLFQPSKNNRNSRWTNTLIRHQFSGNTMHWFIWTKENKYGQVFFTKHYFSSSKSKFTISQIWLCFKSRLRFIHTVSKILLKCTQSRWFYDHFEICTHGVCI